MNMAASLSPKRARDLIAERIGPAASSAAANLGETLMRLGRLDRSKIDQIKAAQAKSGAAFGKTAVKLGFLKSDELRYALGVHLGILHASHEPVVIPDALIVARNPYSAEAEQFRKIRTRLVTGDSERLNLFSLTGADADAGASYVAVNLAASFAQLGKRVLLIDADLRAPMLSRVFGAPGALGVTEIIAGAVAYESACQATLVKRLDLLPAGAGAPDPQSSLASAAFRQILDRAKMEFDVVMVLTSPYGKVADNEFVWAAAREVFVIARKDQTRTDDLVNLRSAARQAGADILGAAMTA